jgi:hypothetical protein
MEEIEERERRSEERGVERSGFFAATARSTLVLYSDFDASVQR